MSDTAWRTLVVESKSDLRLNGETLMIMKEGEKQFFPLIQLRSIMLENSSVTVDKHII